MQQLYGYALKMFLFMRGMAPNEESIHYKKVIATPPLEE
jgi:hypothetical protein